MKLSKDERGFNVLLIPLIIFVIFFMAATGFAIWAYMGRQDYKDNSDQKVAAAVEVAKQETATAKDNEFVEKEKLPLKTYQSPANYGSVVITYPKTWSAFVTETTTGTLPVDGYFHPKFVPGLQSGTAFALRVQTTTTQYDQALRQFDSKVKQGKAKVTPFRAAKVPSVLGARVDGEIATGKQGSVVLLPLRDKTLIITTEANDFVKDFNDNVLPNLSFTP